ncbi:MAG TPA: hypothetical protein VLT36_18835 [Candidatus Dormibacteraeota bacterium]|nr:hypothetical protein [Candidatus Dormibacteraeota bacterium]
MSSKSKLACFALCLCLNPVLASAADPVHWPARVFAPYMYLGMGDDFKLTDCDDACGLKHYTLAFIIARQEGRGTNASYRREPAWDGRTSMDQNLYLDQIEAIRKRAGDVIASFGGEGGRELAIVEEDPAVLQSEYQSIIDRYHFSWLDFDIEGSNLDKHADASRRRNIALAALQSKNPVLRISYTLPVDPNGLSEASQALLVDAKAKGVKVHSANLMVMFFGKRFINKGKSEGELGIESAKKAYERLQKIDPAICVGLCPCLGRNGSSAEVFTLDDAKILKEFADQTPWVCSLHFWSINDDSAKPRKRRSSNGSTNTVNAPENPRIPWKFTAIFKSFTTAAPITK